MSLIGDVAERYEARVNPPPPRFATPGVLARHCDPLTRQTAPLDLIDQAVVDVFDRRVTKQQIYAPPQIGKSQRVSRWTPLWMLVCDPTTRIVIVSAEKELAVRWGRQIKRDLEANPDLGLTLKQDSQAAGRWETAQGGGLFCTGIAAGTTGRPIDVLIIDDPFKDRGSAESKTMRDRVWDFWENDGGVRARRTILMNTRWHTDDLSGRLLEKEPGQWSVLSMPALAETDDPLGREPGQEIASANPELHPPGYYASKQKTTSPYVWSSLYQQRPTAAEGGIFKRGDWRYWQPVPDGMRVNDQAVMLRDTTRFITMDLATSTKTSADFTVACAWAYTRHGDLVLLDRVRQRVPATDHMSLLEPLRQRWLNRYDTTWVESRMFGTTLIHALGRKSLPVRELHADADKFTRALPYADIVSQHRVHLPAEAEWLDSWLDEHADFKPKAARDDQVDCGAYAARVVIAHMATPEGEHEAERRRIAALKASENDVGIDFETAVW